MITPVQPSSDSSSTQSGTWLRDNAILTAALIGALVLALPGQLLREGWNHLFLWIVSVSVPFVIVAGLQAARRRGKLVEYFRDRSFHWLTSRAFFIGLPNVIVGVLGTVWPIEYFTGFQFGMFIGLLIPARYGTLDHPGVPNYAYWLRWSLMGLIGGITTFFVRGRSPAAFLQATAVTLLYGIGLWIGLFLGNKVQEWITALRPVLALVRRMGKTLTAFGIGYGCIIVFFATCFAAVRRMEGPDSFIGLPPTPGLITFLYFSLVSATTIGYGDIVPHTGLSRALMGIETLIAQAWTLVVFAAVAVQFSRYESTTTSTSPSDPEHRGS